MQPYRPLPPDKSLALAIALEDQHIQHFHDWALRFRTFDPALARLFARLAKEMEGYRGELLYHASRYLDWGKCLRSPLQTGESNELQHYFILTKEGAVSVLHAALSLKQDAIRFYRHCSILETPGSLHGGLYKNLGSFQEVQLQRLQEALDHLVLKRRCAGVMIANGRRGRPPVEVRDPARG